MKIPMASLGLICISASVALAEDKTAAVVIDARGDSAIEAPLYQAASEGLTEAGWVVSAASDELKACLRDPGRDSCIGALGAAGAALVVRLRPSNSDASQGVVLLSTMESTAAKSESIQKYCDCRFTDVEKLAPIVRELASDLVARAIREPRSASSVLIRVEPASATVRLNGERVVAGSYEVAAGSHSIEARRPGYVEQTFSVVVETGAQEAVSIELKRKPRSRRNLLAWGLAATGVVAVGGGITLMAIDRGTVQDGEQVLPRNTKEPASLRFRWAQRFWLAPESAFGLPAETPKRRLCRKLPSFRATTAWGCC